ncbi:hypothetical protein [Paraburkholderia sp. C35]|uniref:hypothetical protein n=1 Tax=Paraburkholderia sp. C35 TaxID=2126993 RepID=UPI000D69A440|nr:hypothetical protein [Paraburkholderia sp. C35]
MRTIAITLATLATLTAIASLAGCHSSDSSGAPSAPAANTSITSAPSSSDVQAALGPQIADDYCWVQADNGKPTWPAPVVPAQFHSETRTVLNALTAEGLLDYQGSALAPTADGKKDASWWDSKRGACMGTATVASVTAVRLNHGNPHAPDGSVDVDYVQTLTNVPAWAQKNFKSHVDFSTPLTKHVTLVYDTAAPHDWRRAGVLVKDPSQPTGWREDNVH